MLLHPFLCGHARVCLCVCLSVCLFVIVSLIVACFFMGDKNSNSNSTSTFVVGTDRDWFTQITMTASMLWLPIAVKGGWHFYFIAQARFKRKKVLEELFFRG